MSRGFSEKQQKSKIYQMGTIDSWALEPLKGPQGPNRKAFEALSLPLMALMLAFMARMRLN